MTLRFGLRPFRLNNSKNKYKAVVTDNESVSEKEIIEEMISKGSTVSKAEALAVIEEYEDAICRAIEDGKNVNTRMYKIHAAIKGIFENENDSYDPKNHSVQINVQAGKRLQACADKIKLEKVSLDDSIPVITSFNNLHTNESNLHFSTDHAISISGEKLKFDQEDPKQGIFFINENRSEFRVDNIIKNKPSEIIFLVPDKLLGTKFTLELRCVFHNSKLLRVGKYSDHLIRSTSTTFS